MSDSDEMDVVEEMIRPTDQKKVRAKIKTKHCDHLSCDTNFCPHCGDNLDAPRGDVFGYFENLFKLAKEHERAALYWLGNPDNKEHEGEWLWQKRVDSLHRSTKRAKKMASMLRTLGDLRERADGGTSGNKV